MCFEYSIQLSGDDLQIARVFLSFLEARISFSFVQNCNYVDTEL